jgi:hypothetical protein
MRIATIGSVGVDVREFLSMLGNSPSERLIWLPFAVGVNPHRTAGFHVQPLPGLIQPCERGLPYLAMEHPSYGRVSCPADVLVNPISCSFTVS